MNNADVLGKIIKILENGKISLPGNWYGWTNLVQAGASLKAAGIDHKAAGCAKLNKFLERFPKIEIKSDTSAPHVYYARVRKRTVIIAKKINKKLLNVIQEIVKNQGEAIFDNPLRLKGFISDMAYKEDKSERLAFDYCIKAGFYQKLKLVSQSNERISVKKDFAERLYKDTNLGAILCRNTLDLLETVIFGKQAVSQTVPTYKRATQLKTSPATPPDSFVYIEGGIFMMGSPKSEAGHSSNESPLHKVKLDAFWMGKYPVTQDEYEKIMRANPSWQKAGNLPVSSVTWFDATKYCNQRSSCEQLIPAYTVNNKTGIITWNTRANGYRLPTEAEWEYACRAGTKTAYNWDSDTCDTDKANYYKFSGKSTPVGSYRPNRWGLYDMHGNVWEWCWDWYEKYNASDQVNPPIGRFYEGTDKIIRGGSWFSKKQKLRSASRSGHVPNVGNTAIGFRLAQSAL